MYVIRYTSSAAKALKKAPTAMAQRIRAALEALALDPFDAPNIKKLTARDGYRLRVGIWRVLYVLENGALIILVLEIGDRKEIYR